MEEWYCLEITGECRNRFWYGPFPDEESARNHAYFLYSFSGMDLPGWWNNPHAINWEQRYFRRVWWGMGKIRYEGDKNYVFIGTGYEVFARDIDGNHVITDSVQEQTRVENDAETVEYCAGPMIDDWCEPCEGVEEIANSFNPSLYSEGEIWGDMGGTLEAFNSGSAPYLNQTLVQSSQAEVEAIQTAFGGSLENVWSSDGDNTLFAAFGWGRVARITEEIGGFGVQYGYPLTRQGTYYYVHESDVEGWLAAGCPVNFQWLEHPDCLPWNPLAETFAEPQTYLLGYNYKVELFAQIVSGGTDFATCFTARSQYDLSAMNQLESNFGYPAYLIPNTIHTGFIPAGESLEVSKVGGWWGQPGVYVNLPVGFRHTNNVDGKVVGDMVAPWAISVNFQLTPLFVTANGYNECDIEGVGETQAITIIARCPREDFQRPFPYPGIGVNNNPNFEPWPFTYGLFRETGGTPNPTIPKTTSEFWGWSGNGIDFPTLLILNPTWAVNAFIDNWPPFKRVPGYKKMVEFIRYITGKRSQYQSIGTDPVTGWEVYPVPVIIGADGSGFPVYGPEVYREVPAGKDNG